jgi:hypothetical protein
LAFELEANSVNVDRISGCSIGGVVAALYASGQTAAGVDAICYEEFVRRSPFRDYTLPRVSVARGRKAEAALQRQFDDLYFEELPRQLALVSTDMLKKTAVVHRRGLVRERCASLAPGLFPPVQSVLHRRRCRQFRCTPRQGRGPILAVNIASVGGLSDRGLADAHLPRPCCAMLMGSATAIAAARPRYRHPGYAWNRAVRVPSGRPRQEPPRGRPRRVDALATLLVGRRRAGSRPVGLQTNRWPANDARAQASVGHVRLH